MSEINKIKGYRVMIGLTQEEMANKLGVAVKTYADKEKLQSFKMEELSKIKDIFNEKGMQLSLDDLF